MNDRLTKESLLFVFLLASSHTTYSQQMESACGDLSNHFGPYDYRTAPAHVRTLVEKPHFPPKVERLLGGNTSMTPGGDMSYTLGVFPNHHRALMAVIKLAEKEKRDKPFQMAYTVTCYFDRAERYSPDDAMVKTIYGGYLIQKGKLQEGKEKLDAALTLNLTEGNPNIFYNLGLAYFDTKQYDKSLDSAHRAYALGFPLPGLRDKLKRAGKWHEAEPAPIDPISIKTDKFESIEKP